MTTNNNENEKGKLSYEERCLKWASCFYLFKELPDEFFEMDEASQDAHLVGHAWEPFQGESADAIYGYIDSLARHIIDKKYPASDMDGEDWLPDDTCIDV